LWRRAREGATLGDVDAKRLLARTSDAGSDAKASTLAMEQRWNSDVDDVGEGDHRCCVIDNCDNRGVVRRRLDLGGSQAAARSVIVQVELVDEASADGAKPMMPMRCATP
jgi:hypothetical protein